MENKQTAVEWFYDQITRTYWDYMTSEEQNLLFEEAKQMEKEQLKDAYKTAYNYYQSAEEFYNENYGK